MALIRCPQCRRRMSSLAPSCQNCGYSMDQSQSSASQLAEMRLHRLKQWRYRLRMASYTAMTLMLAAIIVWWLDSGLLAAPGVFVKLAMAFGVVTYLLLRSTLFWLATQIKQARKTIIESRG